MLVPQVLWIIFDLMLLQKREELVLVRTLTMVFGLAVNVNNRVVSLNPDTERTVPFLPCEMAVRGERVVDPLGGAPLSNWRAFEMLTVVGSDNRT